MSDKPAIDLTAAPALKKVETVEKSCLPSAA